jgi:hypothetical protein
MAEIKRNFIQGRMNKDIEKRKLPDGVYTDAKNITVGSSGDQKVGSVQNDKGNEQLSDIEVVSGQDVDNAQTIGVKAVSSINKIYWLVASDKFDAIFELDRDTNQTTRVLQSNKSTPTTPSLLNFSKTELVTGIDYINGMLLFTELINGPRKINIARCKTYSVDDPMIVKDLNLIVKPPLFAPNITLSNDGSQNNNMQDKFLYFAYRFKYMDNEYSSLSPFSSVSFGPEEYIYNPAQGYNKAMINRFNKVSLSVETGDELVTDIQIIMYDVSGKNTFIVETLNKEELSISDNTSYVFQDFSNNKVYTSLPSSQITRLFDNVPLGAKAQSIISNRVVFGNVIQFRDIKDEFGQDIKVDFSVGLVNDIATPTLAAPLPTFKSNRDYELALVYLDEFGRMTTGLTSLNNTVYIPHVNAINSNSLLVNIKSKAPEWATHWRIFIKQSKEEYYTLYPLLFYKEGVYRYFLINNVDRDKVNEGDYIVFKSDNGGISYSGKEYKVLEVAQKNADFLGGNASTELAGLYFKIKVDNNSELSPNTLFQYSSTTTGVNSTPETTFNPGETTFPPVTGSFAYAENAIFYGEGNGNALTVINDLYNPNVDIKRDLRFTVEIDSLTTFRYTYSLDGAGPFVAENVTIVLNTDIPLLYYNISAVYIRFNSTSGLVIGDKWKVITRGPLYDDPVLNPNYFSSTGLATLQSTAQGISQKSGGYAIVPGENWGLSVSGMEVDRPILVGAIITLGLIEDRYNSAGTYGPIQFPPSDSTYVNIEEWFVESGAYQLYHQYNDTGADIGANQISFRRGGLFQYQGGTNGGDLTNTVFAGNSISGWSLNLPMRMFIMGYGVNNGSDNQNHVTASFKIQQQTNQTIVETVPSINDTDIYHEITRTRRVGPNGEHIVNWHYDDFIFYGSSTPANGYTGLTQLTPYEPHMFNIGETINVVTTVPWLNGQATIIEIPDLYTIVVDVIFAASGPVTGGYVEANDYDLDQSLSSPQGAKVIINNPNNFNDEFNAWSFGNGIETNRIKDDFNAITKKYSQRATSNIEDYKQLHNENELVYSGVYQETTSVNRLNEFNLSTVNFKYADKQYGSIQKLYSRDSDLLMLQEHKISSILYEKNLLSDSTGGGTVASVPEILGTILPFRYENGISKNPESFAVFGSDIFLTDAYRGVALNVTGDKVFEISALGMKNYFKTMFADGLNKRKIGAFDPYVKNYILGSNNISTDSCYLTVDRSRVLLTYNALSGLNLFSIVSNSDWGLELIDEGFGIDWLLIFPESGNGNGKIKGTTTLNDTEENRELTIRITYCGGITLDVLIIQTPEKVRAVGNIYFINKNENESKSKL